MELGASQILWLGPVRRAAEEHRELVDLPDVIALRLPAELADGHVLDHPPTQRRNGFGGHLRSTMRLTAGCDAASAGGLM